MEKGKILRNLEKLALRDFEFINAGRITIVADNKNITTDLINSLCLKLDIEPNRIHKKDLVQIIDYIIFDVKKDELDNYLGNGWKVIANNKETFTIAYEWE